MKVINQQEGKSIVNCLNFNEIGELADEAEIRLAEIGVPKRERVGAKYYYVPAGPRAKSYSYGQGATALEIIKESTGWSIETIFRTKVYPQAPEARLLKLTESQRYCCQKILQHF